MHPRLHAVAGAGGVSILPDDQGQSLATIALKVALAFYLAAREEKAGLIEDAGDGAEASGMILHPKIAHACGNLPNADRCFCRYKGDA
jgi:hypothetical protein